MTFDELLLSFWPVTRRLPALAGEPTALQTGQNVNEVASVPLNLDFMDTAKLSLLHRG